MRDFFVYMIIIFPQNRKQRSLLQSSIIKATYYIIAEWVREAFEYLEKQKARGRILQKWG